MRIGEVSPSGGRSDRLSPVRHLAHLALWLSTSVALGGWLLSLVLREDSETLAHLSSILDVAPQAVHEIIDQHAERFSGVALAPIALVGSIWLGSGAFDTVMAVFERTKATDPRPWYVRRLAERPANAMFILKNMFRK